MEWLLVILSLVEGLVEAENIRNYGSIIFSNSVNLVESSLVILFVRHWSQGGEQIHSLGADLEQVSLELRNEGISKVVSIDLNAWEVVDSILDEHSEFAELKVVVENVHNINSSIHGIIVRKLEVGGLLNVVFQLGEVGRDPVSKALVTDHVDLGASVVASQESIPHVLEDLVTKLNVIPSQLEVIDAGHIRHVVRNVVVVFHEKLGWGVRDQEGQ